MFGFSRGAYTARALTGMLRTVGLLRPGAENLVPYALKLYAQSGGQTRPRTRSEEFWRLRRDFTDRFGNPDLPNPFDPHRHQVHFLGVWDTVQDDRLAELQGAARAGALAVHAAASPTWGSARHAMALDERRRPYPVYRFDPTIVRGVRGQVRRAVVRRGAQ